jgi:hypothetical protein
MRLALSAIAVLALLVNAFLFDNGGIGGAVAIAIFWAALAVYLALSFYEDVIKRTPGRRAMVVRWVLLALGVVCILPLGIDGESWATDLARAYFPGALVAVLLLSARDMWKRRRALEPAGG